MALTVEAIYENGDFKPAQALPLKEHQQVTLTVQVQSNWIQRTAGLIPCSDPKVIEWVAQDADLEYPPLRMMHVFHGPCAGFGSLRGC
jgi:predicted DNA-binding antitoxin AbrB/MazE fold protein